MRTFRLFVLRRLVQAPLRAVTTTLAIAAGVALAVSISILIASIDRSLGEFGRGLAGPADLRISGATMRGGLPLDVLNRAEGVTGVEAIVPLVQMVSPTQRRPGAAVEPALVLGVDCSVEALVGPFGCDPALLDAADGAVAVGPSVDRGPDAVLRTDRGRLAIGTTPVVAQLGAVGDGRVVVLPLADAQHHFTRPDQVDVAYVLVAPGEDPAVVARELQAAVGAQFPVLAAVEPPASARAVLQGALPIYSMLSAFALGIGGVLVSSTAAMALETRRRELAVLGALGGRARTVLGASVAEAALLGAVGGLLGSGGGVLVARPVVGSLSSFTEEVTGASLHTFVPASSVVIGVVLGVLLGAGAALVPARRAARLDIAGELSGREAADQSRAPRLGRRLACWSAVTALGVIGCWTTQRRGGLEPWQATIVTPAFLTVAIGMLFSTAAAVPLLTGALGSATASIESGPWRLGLAAARRDHRRSGLLAVTVAAAVVTAFVTEGSSASARAEIEQSFERAGEGVDVTTVPAEERFGALVPDELLADLATVPGVAEVQEATFVLAGSGADLVLVQASTGHPALTADLIDGVADPDRLEAGEVLIGAGLARRQQVGAGDLVRVTTPRGEAELPVQGVWEEGNNVGANVTMSSSLLEQLFGPQPTHRVGLRPQAGVSDEELAARVRAAGLDPELRTRTAPEVADDIADVVDGQLASFRVMQRALLAVLLVAVISSLLLAAIQRRRELALLAAVGAEPADLARALVLEAGVVAVLGVAISTLGGPLMQWALTQVMPFLVGFRDPVTLTWSPLLTVGATAVAIVLAGAAWPARRAARIEVLEALRYE